MSNLEASARHILVETQEECEKLKQEIAEGRDFAEAAMAHSKCPSAAQGGALGTFRPGQMVKEFNDVVFNDEVGVVHGPVETQFGFHLVETTHRGEVVEAEARHILVESEELANELKTEIENGADFAEIAQANSKCPSGQSGGALGRFGKGQMVPEFDEVVFSGELHKVLGPVKTQFGYHLIEITDRTGE